MKISRKSWHYRFLNWMCGYGIELEKKSSCSYVVSLLTNMFMVIMLVVVSLFVLVGAGIGTHFMFTGDINNPPSDGHAVCFIFALLFWIVVLLTLISKVLWPYIMRPVFVFLLDMFIAFFVVTVDGITKLAKSSDSEPSSFMQLLKSFKTKICVKLDYID